jgi:hypothetical protein
MGDGGADKIILKWSWGGCENVDSAGSGSSQVTGFSEHGGQP